MLAGIKAKHKFIFVLVIISSFAIFLTSAEAAILPTQNSNDTNVIKWLNVSIYSIQKMMIFYKTKRFVRLTDHNFLHSFHFKASV